MALRSDITEQDTWFKGEKKELRWIIDDGAGGVPPGMDPWVMLFIMRMTADSPQVMLQLDVVTEDPGDGTVLCNVVHGDTIDIPSGDYYYNVVRVDTGEEQVLAYGDALLMEPAGLKGVMISAPMASGGGGT